MDTLKIIPLLGHTDEQLAGIFDSCWYDVEPSILMHSAAGYRRVANWLDVAPNASGVAYLSDEPAGIVLTGLREPDRGYIASLAVRSSMRGKGIGRRLMNWGIARARIHGCRKLGLHVFEDNDAARRLYSSLGFFTVRNIGHWEGQIRIKRNMDMDLSYPSIAEAAEVFPEKRREKLWENEPQSIANISESTITVLASESGEAFGYMVYSTRSLCWIMDMCFREGTTAEQAGALLHSVPTARFFPAVFTTVPEGSDNERILEELGLKLHRKRVEMQLLFSGEGLA